MFILCVTKGQKILFLFKDEELSSIHILNDERVFFIAQPIQQVFYYSRSSYTNIHGDSSVAHNTKDRFMTVAILKCELIMCLAIVNF